MIINQKYQTKQDVRNATFPLYINSLSLSYFTHISTNKLAHNGCCFFFPPTPPPHYHPPLRRHRPPSPPCRHPQLQDALTKSIMFFEGQRSGKLPPNQRITWRKNSGLSDGAAMKVDLVGGYYDAGDNIKFGFPMAFTHTLGLPIIYSKLLAQPDVIYVQVGDATKDHACWERPEDMDTPKNRLKIDRNTPGTEVAAETAAALASASLVFRKSDRTYSKLLLKRAIRCLSLLTSIEGALQQWAQKICVPILLFLFRIRGSYWLHKATRSPKYLNYIQRNGQSLGGGETDNTFGWDNKHAGARVLLSKAFLVQKLQSLHDYKGHADNFICSLIPGAPFSQSEYTPGGLLFKMDDSNMQYVTSASFLLVTYAKYLTQAKKVVNCGGSIVTPKRLRSIAKNKWTTTR
ncbi:putative cellulase [Helianthus annuus]|nr:putative cellulase [Helianthus annuus]